MFATGEASAPTFSSIATNVEAVTSKAGHVPPDKATRDDVDGFLAWLEACRRFSAEHGDATLQLLMGD
jgi:hypothetical protein